MNLLSVFLLNSIFDTTSTKSFDRLSQSFAITIVNGLLSNPVSSSSYAIVLPFSPSVSLPFSSGIGSQNNPGLQSGSQRSCLSWSHLLPYIFPWSTTLAVFPLPISHVPQLSKSECKMINALRYFNTLPDVAPCIDAMLSVHYDKRPKRC